MFTGIVEEVGVLEKIVKNQYSANLTIKAKKVLQNTKIGDSISTNGICLTVTSIKNSSFTVDVMLETIKSTNLLYLKPLDKLNLERAMCLGDRFGGHIVSGHIDGVGKIVEKTLVDIATKLTISTNSQILKYIIKKGSITIDGVSLTVSEVLNDCFSVFIIPHTSKETTIYLKNVDDIVNLENDLLAKYVEKLMNPPKEQAVSKIDEVFLNKYGFI